MLVEGSNSATNAGTTATDCPLHTAAPMLRDRAVCCAGNAVRPRALLSRLFDIPLPRTRPFRLAYRSAATFSSSAVRPRSDDEDPYAAFVVPSSLDVTLEAHRRANRAAPFQPAAAAPAAASADGSLPEAPQSLDESQELAREERFPPGVVKRRLKAGERVIPPPDYRGQYVAPLSRKKGLRDQELPWFDQYLQEINNPIERFRAEVKAFVRYMEPTPEEHHGRDFVVQQTHRSWQQFVRSNPRWLRRFELEAFGSQQTGLATATSDIDFRITNFRVLGESDPEKAPRFGRRTEGLQLLRRAFSFYCEHTDFLNTSLLHARYPLISMQHRHTSLDVQLVCCNDTSRAQALVAQYRAELPAAYDLYMLLRRTLDIRGLCDVFMGGLGSYGLFYLIVAGMKFGKPAPADDPAAQLLAVLEFYSDFDATNNWISLDPLSIQPKVLGAKYSAKKERIGLQSPERPYLLSIRDPADRTNDLGFKTFNWRHIQQTLKTLNRDLCRKLERNERSLLLRPFVGDDFGMLDERRAWLVYSGKKYERVRKVLRVRSNSVQDWPSEDEDDHTAAVSPRSE